MSSPDDNPGRRTIRPAVPAVPSRAEEEAAGWAFDSAIKEVLEVLVGRRGFPRDRAVTVREIDNLHLPTLDIDVAAWRGDRTLAAGADGAVTLTDQLFPGRNGWLAAFGDSVTLVGGGGDAAPAVVAIYMDAVGYPGPHPAPGTVEVALVPDAAGVSPRFAPVAAVILPMSPGDRVTAFARNRLADTDVTVDVNLYALALVQRGGR